jgi:broad specificity phosphatase PhoE
VEKPRSPSVFDEAFLTGVPNVSEIILIRHAQQDFDPAGPFKDLIDQPLSEQGRQQARLLGESMSTLQIDAVYSSPLHRALDTARAVAAHHQLEAQVMTDLREVEIFRDLPAEKRPEQVLGKELLRALRDRMVNERSWDVYPYSESSAEFRRRTINAVETAIAAHKAERIAIVCHGGVINSYIGHIIGSRYDMFFRPGHTAVNIIDAGGSRRVLRLLNDLRHLRTGEGDFSTY